MLLLTPLAAAAFHALENALLFAIIATEGEAGGFDDLGLLLFGGVFVAIAVGVGFTLIRLRLRDKKTDAPAFISITARNKNP